MNYIGAHVNGGVIKAPSNEHAVGGNALAFFTKNEREWTVPPLKEEVINIFKRQCKEFGYTAKQILPHAGYLINLGHPDKFQREHSRSAMIDELERCAVLGITMLNVHPGSNLGLVSIDACLALISESVNFVLSKTKGVTLVFENSAGQGDSVGYEFGHIATFIDKVEDKSRIGSCFDICHAFEAGYDLSTKEGCIKVFEQYNQTVGFHYLRGMHLHDSKTALNNYLDRHTNLGQGHIGKVVFEYVVKDPRFDNIPLILETPDPKLWKQEISWLQSLA